MLEVLLTADAALPPLAAALASGTPVAEQLAAAAAAAAAVAAAAAARAPRPRATTAAAAAEIDDNTSVGGFGRTRLRSPVVKTEPARPASAPALLPLAAAAADGAASATASGDVSDGSSAGGGVGAVAALRKTASDAATRRAYEPAQVRVSFVSPRAAERRFANVLHHSWPTCCFQQHPSRCLDWSLCSDMPPWYTTGKISHQAIQIVRRQLLGAAHHQIGKHCSSHIR